MDADLAAKLRALAERVARNVPHRRAERFHTEKSCIAQDLEHLAQELDERSSAHPARIEVNRKQRAQLTRNSTRSKCSAISTPTDAVTVPTNAMRSRCFSGIHC
jgi:hypothetical protein